VNVNLVFDKADDGRVETQSTKAAPEVINLDSDDEESNAMSDGNVGIGLVGSANWEGEMGGADEQVHQDESDTEAEIKLRLKKIELEKAEVDLKLALLKMQRQNRS
jgi:hypothetical protein